MRRKIVQIAAYYDPNAQEDGVIIALANDGTLWEFAREYDPEKNISIVGWSQLPPLPDEPQQ